MSTPRKERSGIPFTGSWFRLGEPNVSAICFIISGTSRKVVVVTTYLRSRAPPGPCSPNACSFDQRSTSSQESSESESMGTTSALSPSLTSSIPGLPSTQAVPAHTLAALRLTQTKDKPERIRTFIRTRLPNAPTLFHTTLFYFLVFHFLLSIVHSAQPLVACVVPTRLSFQSDVRCDWYLSVFSHFIPLRHDFASARAGAVIAPRLSTPDLEPSGNPLSSVSTNSTSSCWSFRGNTGTFGIALNAPNVLPSHIVMQHKSSNSMTILSRSPQQVVVWGLVDGMINMEAYRQLRGMLASTFSGFPPFPLLREGVFLPLADFEFNITAPSMRQIFPFYDEVPSWGIDFGVIVVHVRSNWGANVTSLCSVHIYGHTNLRTILPRLDEGNSYSE